MVNPETVPFSSQFFLSLDASFTQIANSSQAKNITKKVPVYDLKVESTIKISGICDSVLFGPPVIIFATRCWKMDWEELESNQKHFAALNNLLKEKGVVLLARRQAKLYISNADNRGSPPNGYYVIFPSNNQSMLIKSIITKEFLLPNVMGSVTEVMIPSDEAKTRVSDSLKHLECWETYNPLSVSCGLYSHLANSLRKKKPQRVCKNVISSNSQSGKIRHLAPCPDTSNKRLRKTPQTKETELQFIAVGNKKNFLSTANSKISHLLNRNFPKDL
ncbi:meiosis 1 arrest protein-like [Limulus polyphemus]|uniref:Meiosis 1 arrest protein-like n=1 Tax=Limulus polyphemus TaxID=6850 RepID=A0ABM1SL18_LIMPO|nr:meiosis 1 arrest protein-like [Limulus polyphemus]